MAKYAAAIDQGTTSTRCMVFDHGGNVVSVAQKEHEQIYPKPGWVEHDVTEIWARTQEVVDEAMASAGASAGDVAGVGITNQRETAVVWDKNTGEPIHNALVWQDTRTDKLVDEYSRDGGQARFQEKVGLPLATYFSGPKIRWILDNVDGAADEGRLRRPAVRQHGHLDPLEPHGRHRRRPAHHRSDERQPHDADGPQDPRLGLRGHGRHGRSRGRCCRRSRPPPRSTARSARAARCRACRSPATSATSRRRRSGRPASASARPRTRTARATSCCSTRARRRSPSKNGLLTTVGYKIGDNKPDLLPRGLDRHHRARSCSGCATT